MTTPTLAAAGPVRRRSSTRVATRWLLSRNFVMAAWAAGILVLAVVVGPVLVDRFTTVEISVAQFGRQGFTWFPFSIAIITSSVYINVHVAAGMTRRSLGRASLVQAVTMAATYTVIMTVVLQLEALAFDAVGWGHKIVDENALFQDSSQVGWILADLGLVFLTAQVSGLLVGIVYYRLGGWWGTLALPFTVGPLILVSPLLTSTLLDPIAPLARVPLVGLVPVVLAALYLAVLRNAPLRKVAT